ncbi:hypothetical protein C7M84_010882 [Penaeus vannamei]|uniref:Uncharacterized protein n=1 Tax=Penaeus vannamei TaxID=6689 RepID=A0A3R7PG91_PENVA|nr:hypothetical protein C7M84_010882 [Penaeus vannamei]
MPYSCSAPLLSPPFSIAPLSPFISRTPTDAGEGPRRPDEEDLLQYVADGGADALAEGLPQLIVPLLRNLSEASREAQPEDSCIQRPLCEANAALTHRYGALGRVVGAFVSNVAARALVGSDPPRYQLALEASQRGRASREGAEDAFCAAQFPCLAATPTPPRSAEDRWRWVKGRIEGLYPGKPFFTPTKPEDRSSILKMRTSRSLDQPSLDPAGLDRPWSTRSAGHCRRSPGYPTSCVQLCFQGVRASSSSLPAHSRPP